MGTVPNPWIKHEESDERAAETVVFGRGKSDSTAKVASSWYHSCILYGRDRVAPLVAVHSVLTPLLGKIHLFATHNITLPDLL